MNKYIITGLSALYDLGFSRFKPTKLNIELIYGSNSTNYNQEKYVISTQNKYTFNIGTIIVNDKRYYCPERLFIDFDRFPMENTIKAQTLKKLENEINPQKVKDIYLKIKTKRKQINHERIETYLNKNLLDIELLLLDKTIDIDHLLREYIIALMSKDNLITSLIKGGSAIELYLQFHRSTHDIDSHIGKTDINKVLKIFKNKENLIYFEILNLNQLEIDLNKNKPIIKLLLKPKSKKIKINEILDKANMIEISLNSIYTKNELEEIIKDYQITKTNLKLIKNGFGLIFSKEMILAEKYLTLILNNKNCTRTKDLMDLYMLYYENKIDFNKFLKWMYKKAQNKTKNPLDKNELNQLIKLNQSIELTKIKDNFQQAIKMYDIKLNYDDCLKTYETISELILKNN